MPKPLSQGEMMVWAAAYTARYFIDPSDEAVDEAIKAAWCSVEDIRSSLPSTIDKLGGRSYVTTMLKQMLGEEL